MKNAGNRYRNRHRGVWGTSGTATSSAPGRVLLPATLIVLVSILLPGSLAGCNPDDAGSSGTTSSSGTGTGSPSAAPVKTLPDGVGKGLKYAYDAAQQAGFTHLRTHDSSGRMRTQVLYTDWKVCFMAPGPGPVPTSTMIDYGVVKLNETCPASDRGLVTVTAGATMPDLRGHSARYARDVLGSNASISYRTPKGQSARVIVDSNWEICEQTPAPGEPYAGVPVTLVVVQYSDGGCASAR